MLSFRGSVPERANDVKLLSKVITTIFCIRACDGRSYGDNDETKGGSLVNQVSGSDFNKLYRVGDEDEKSIQNP